jgi:hypothetical protein
LPPILRYLRGRERRYVSAAAAVVALLALFALPQRAIAASEPLAAPAGVHANAPADPTLATRIGSLDCSCITARDVRDVLSRVPAPRIIALSGSLTLVTMEPFARFLVAMGYPEERIRNPADGAWAYESSASSTALAGALAWHYERDGMVPMLIGHSQGGMLVLRTLYELAGAFGDSIPVWNPLTGEALPRSTIVDPVDGTTRPVVGLRVGYAAALATGKLPRVLLGQWTMLAKLRHVPDTVDEFTGLSIEWDPIAGNFPGAEPYAASGSAVVRNVTLPASYSHIGLPRTLHLAGNEITRAWIDAYAPGSGTAASPDDSAVDRANIVHAADVWYSVKKRWCVEAQRLSHAASKR